MDEKSHSGNSCFSRKWRLLTTATIGFSSIVLGQNPDTSDNQVFELSPFVVDASDDMGYYASESLAGGRLSTDIINTGSSIEVVTADFMDDIGANDIQELLQYTNNTEIGGVLGNFVGASVDASQGNVDSAQSQRNPDANSRIRGLSTPDSTRDFFKTEIPFDQYNTERVDINRGSNSFLFGLGSPSGLINSQLSKAHFDDRTELRFRLGSGGDRPSYRAEFDINRVAIKDKLAIRVAGLMNRTQYRQEPTYRDDDRIYATLTYYPFENKQTTVRAHWESGDIISNSAATVLPGTTLDTFVKYRLPIDVDYNTRVYRQQYGFNAGDVNASPDRYPEIVELTGQAYWPSYDLDSAGKVTKDEGGVDIFNRPGIPGLVGNMGANGYALIFDGANGLAPSMILQNQYRAAADVFVQGAGSWKKVSGEWQWQTNTPGDAWWSPDGRNSGNPSMVVYQNSFNDPNKGVGWFKQGITDLEMFDFSKQHIAGNNDFWARDFYNYNFAIEQLLFDGKGGFEIAYDFQNTVRDTWTAFTASGADISIDINRTIPLPQVDSSGQILTDESGNMIIGARENPNFGRPFIVSKTGRGFNRNDRSALRATAFYKLDFEEISEGRDWLKWLGSHTFSVLGDQNVEEYEYFGTSLRSFSDDWDVGAHLGDSSGRKATTAIRTVPLIAYIGPPIQSYIPDVWNPATPLSVSDIIIHPADYNLLTPNGWSMPMMYWNKGLDAEHAPEDEIGLRQYINGDEHWATGNLSPQWVPDEGVQIRRTEVKSWAVNAQSFFLNRHLVLNTGYREDYIDSWLNKAVPKVGEDLVPDISPEAFRWQDGEYSKIEKGPTGSGTFGYGAVLHWPKGIVKLPESTDISFHYNYSENFIPDASRLGIEAAGSGVELNRLPSPTGESTDYGVTFQLFDRKLIVRLNWYENKLVGADSSLNALFNQNLSKMFAWYNNNNKKRTLLDSSDGTIKGSYDGVISNAQEIDLNRQAQLDASGEQIIIDDSDPGNIQYLMETDSMVIAREWPAWDQLVGARNELYDVLQKGYWQLKESRDRLTIFQDGGTDDEWLNGLTDLEDLVAKGFEASITFNPTRNWRMRINVAQQETTASNIAPRLTRFIEQDWLPWVIKYGELDWSDTAAPVAGETIAENVNENLLKYFTTKSLDGFPSDEVREWRVSMVTNYSFREGRLKGFNLGGSMRYQSEAAIGYPLIQSEVLPGSMITVGDINNPWMGESEWSYDLLLGYARKIFDDKVNWSIQLNIRNLQNINSDELSVITAQPDGSAAKVRWDPPFQMQLTNTFRW